MSYYTFYNIELHFNYVYNSLLAAITTRTDSLREYLFRKRLRVQSNYSNEQAYKKGHSHSNMEIKEQEKSIMNINFDR